MPIKSCKLPNGKSGFKFGDKGKCFATRAESLKQARTEFANCYKGKAAIEELKSSLTAEEHLELDSVIVEMEKEIWKERNPEQAWVEDLQQLIKERDKNVQENKA